MTDQTTPSQPGYPYGQQPQGQPYAQQPYGAAPIPGPPQPKKKRTWPWLLGAIVVLLIVISALSGGGSDKSDDTASSGSTSAASGGGDAAVDAGANSDNDKPAVGLNTPVRDGKFEFVVTGVESGVAEVGDNPYLTEKAQGQFVIVSLTVKNISDKPQSFAPGSQKLVDDQGRSFESNTSAQVALGGSDITIWDNINPGNAVQAKVVYDMPAGAVPARIELHDSMFSGGESVSLK